VFSFENLGKDLFASTSATSVLCFANKFI
jgi:hypothetical protein